MGVDAPLELMTNYYIPPCTKEVPPQPVPKVGYLRTFPLIRAAAAHGVSRVVGVVATCMPRGLRPCCGHQSAVASCAMLSWLLDLVPSCTVAAVRPSVHKRLLITSICNAGLLRHHLPH